MALVTFQGAKPGCPTMCGNITVPYPFGIGIDCSLDDSFNLSYNTSSYEPPKLFFGKYILRIYNISDLELRVHSIISYVCNDQSGIVTGDVIDDYISTGCKAFTLSEKNKFIVIGCDAYALIEGADGAYFSGDCVGICPRGRYVPKVQCSGIGCCQTSIPKGHSYYTNSLYTIRQNNSDVWSLNKCGYGFVVEEGSFEFGGATDLSSNHLDFVNRIESAMPSVIDWVIAPEGTCTSEVNTCKGNSKCYDVEGGGYHCRCNQGYDGNPYLDPGCQGTSPHS